MKTVPFFASIIIALLLVTCRGEDYTQDLSEIDSLKKVLVSTDSLIASVNTAEVARRTQEIADNSKFIQFNVRNLGDTLDYSTALLLTEYRETGNRFQFVNDEVKRLSSAIDSINIGLENLKHDLENQSLAEGVDGKASVVHESTQVNAIHSYAVELIASLNNTRKSYDTLLPKVNTYVNQMSARVSSGQLP